MELQFKSIDCPCLEPVVGQVQNGEQTQELRLSEGMPDIRQILGGWGQVLLRGKEWLGDSIGCTGGVMVWVLYTGEDGSFQVLKGWVPFQMKWDLPEDAPEGSIRVDCLLRSLDARQLSDRKMMLRVGIAALAEGYSPRSVRIFQPESASEGVELLHTSYPVTLIGEAGEKSFQLDEILELPDGVGEILGCTLSPRITDRKIMGSRLVFRGAGKVQLRYQEEDGRLGCWEQEVSFSQFAQLAESYDGEAQADTVLCITALEAERGENGQLQLKCGLLCQYTIARRELLEMVEDAYCPGYGLDIQWQEAAVPVVLDNHRETIRGETHLDGEAAQAVDLTFFRDFPRKTGEQMLEYPGNLQLLYYDDQGNLQQTGGKWMASQKLPMAENARWTAHPQPPQSLGTVTDGNGVMGKVELPVEWSVTAVQPFTMVAGVTLGQPQERQEDRPSLILRRPGTSRLWDIAKQSGSTVAAIREVNHLNADPAPDQLLLIPVR